MMKYCINIIIITTTTTTTTTTTNTNTAPHITVGTNIENRLFSRINNSFYIYILYNTNNNI